VRAPVSAENAGLIESIFDSIQGVVAKFPRSLFLRRAREGGNARELWEALVAADLLSLGIPERLGGAGGGLTACTAVMEGLAQAGVPPLLYALTTFSREAILKHGSPEQVRDHVLPTMTGERKICLGVTEPEAGTNSFAARTRARAAGHGSYVIDGQKVYISGADEADHIQLLTRTAPASRSAGGRASGCSS
jgi:hypothetical protein